MGLVKIIDKMHQLVGYFPIAAENKIVYQGVGYSFWDLLLNQCIYLGIVYDFKPQQLLLRSATLAQSNVGSPRTHCYSNCIEQLIVRCQYFPTAFNGQGIGSSFG